MTAPASILDLPRSRVFEDEEFALFEQSVGRFLDTHAGPETMQRWRDQGIVDRAAWHQAGRDGILGLSIPAEHGGAGGDFRHEYILYRELGLRGIVGWGMPLHNAIVMPYIVDYGTPEQKRRLLPAMCRGDLVGAIAMTEPGAGSDLQGVRTTARRVGDHYVLNGQKTFITNGQTADVILVVAKTDPQAGGRGVSLLLVETREAPGFRRGRNLDKVGMEAADTSELFFDEVPVPAENLLGGVEGQGFAQLMSSLPQERVLIAAEAIGLMERALAVTAAYVKERHAFGKRILDFQNTQFKLAECKTEATIARVFVEHCVEQLLSKSLSTTTASMAKYWTTDTLCRIVDECVQLHGGYGYMSEYPIAQLYKDCRVLRIYGGTNEIMKLLISRSI